MKVQIVMTPENEEDKNLLKEAMNTPFAPEANPEFIRNQDGNNGTDITEARFTLNLGAQKDREPTIDRGLLISFRTVVRHVFWQPHS